MDLSNCRYLLIVIFLGASIADKYDDAIQDEMEYGSILGASVAFYDGVSEGGGQRMQLQRVNRNCDYFLTNLLLISCFAHMIVERIHNPIFVY